MISKKIAFVRRCSSSVFLRPCAPIRLYEYQIKKLFSENNLNVQRFQVVENPHDAQRVGQQLMKTIAKELLIKAQIRNNGFDQSTYDDKPPIIRSYRSSEPTECFGLFKRIINETKINPEISATSNIVKKVMIAESLELVRQMYVAIHLDSAQGVPVLISSKDSDGFQQFHINPIIGLNQIQAFEIANRLGFENRLLEQAAGQLMKLYKFFVKYDCLDIEVHPFGETKDRRVVHVNAGVNFDPRAKYRQSKLVEVQEPLSTDLFEDQAELGCLVDDSSMALTVNDSFHQHGFENVQFITLNAPEEQQLQTVFDILFAKPQFKVIFINTFGSWISCNLVVTELIKARHRWNSEIPLVIRLFDSNLNETWKTVEQNSFSIFIETDFEKAIEKVLSFLRTNQV